MKTITKEELIDRILTNIEIIESGGLTIYNKIESTNFLYLSLSNLIK